MSSLAEIVGWIGAGVVNTIFGHPIFAAIFVILFIMVILWAVGVGKDGVVVIVVPLILLFASYSFLPEAVSLITWMIIGIMAFLIFIRLLE